MKQGENTKYYCIKQHDMTECAARLHRKEIYMNLSRFVQKDLFAILSIILIVCVVDQLYMMMEYKNISKETLIFTILLTGVSVFFGFLKKD